MFVFVSGLLGLHMYGRISDSEMEPYHPWVWRDLDHEPQPNRKTASGVGAGSTRGGARFHPGVVGVVDVREDF